MNDEIREIIDDIEFNPRRRVAYGRGVQLIKRKVNNEWQLVRNTEIGKSTKTAFETEEQADDKFKKLKKKYQLTEIE